MQSNPFLLIFRNTGPGNYRGLSLEQRRELMTRWNAWYDDLAAQGKVTMGSPLEDDARVVAGPAGTRVVDGPFAEAKEAVGGFVTILAADLAEATELARRHPGMDYGMQIEVRPMAPCCHLARSLGWTTMRGPEAAPLA